MLKTNTSKRREHSLFRQGCMVYGMIPTMPERWLQPLMLAFRRLLNAAVVLSDAGPRVMTWCIYEGRHEPSPASDQAGWDIALPDEKSPRA